MKPWGFRVSVPMRLHFKQRPWDLYIALGYTLASTGTIVLFGRGQLGAVFLVLFAPGYVMTAALFPQGSQSPSWVENRFRGDGRREVNDERAESHTREGIDWTER